MPPSRSLAAALVGCVLAAMFGMAGCGGTTTRKVADDKPSVDQAALDCRAQWRTLGDRLAGRDQRPFPSDLAARWTSVLAGIDYHATSASAEDCDQPLSDQRAEVTRVVDFTKSLRVYDVRYRLSVLRRTASAYLTAPKLPARIGKSVPSKKAVRRALATATKTAPAAVADMRDGWTGAETADLTDDTARTRALADLKFLAGDSMPFQQCVAALRVLRKVPRAAG